MNSTVLQNHSDAQNSCATRFNGAKLAVLETHLETADVFKLLGLTNETRYAIGPFPPCGNDTCYFVIGRASGAYQVGLASCDTTLHFICEGEMIYEGLLILNILFVFISKGCRFFPLNTKNKEQFYKGCTKCN